MEKMWTLIKKFVKEEEGMETVEYAVVGALVVAAAAAVWIDTWRVQFRHKYQTLNKLLWLIDLSCPTGQKAICFGFLEGRSIARE